MSKKRLFLVLPCLMVLIAISYYSCVKDVATLPDALSQTFCDTTDTRFSAVIQPMMQTYCATTNACHDGSAVAMGPGNLNLYADVKSFYDSGVLETRVLDEKTMPPAGSPALPDSMINKLKCWMGKGAKNN